ncbi:MAG TPA: hypothetical protein VN667_11675, partial [Burkholderiales bacterium]|nr:hypothetical protein [Burkholderiales bacterium]
MSVATNMRIVPARQGLNWLVNGWRLFKRTPGAWLALVAVYWLLVTLLNEVRYAGPLAATVLLPAFSVSFMNISAEAAAGNRLLIT